MKKLLFLLMGFVCFWATAQNPTSMMPDFYVNFTDSLTVANDTITGTFKIPGNRPVAVVSIDIMVYASNTTNQPLQNTTSYLQFPSSISLTPSVSTPDGTALNVFRVPLGNAIGGSFYECYIPVTRGSFPGGQDIKYLATTVSGASLNRLFVSIGFVYLDINGRPFYQGN